MHTASCVQNGTDIWLTVGVDIDDDRLWVGSNAVVIGDEGNETLVRGTVYIVGLLTALCFAHAPTAFSPRRSWCGHS